MKYDVIIKVPQPDSKARFMLDTILPAAKDNLNRMMQTEKIQTGQIIKKLATNNMLTDLETLIINYCDKFKVEQTVVVDYDVLTTEKTELQAKIDTWESDSDLTYPELMPEYIAATKRIQDINNILNPIDLYIAGDLTLKVKLHETN